MTVQSIESSIEKLMNEEQAATYLGFTTRALQAWRCRGGGPKYIKISARAIRYRLADLREWADLRVRASTSDTGGRHE